MILPSKHLKISESLLGLGGYLLNYLKGGPQTVDHLWFKVSKQNNSKKSFAYHGFDNVIFALNYLYIIGAIDINSEGEIFNAINKAKSE
ncbi:ABC-three component system middle component 6 [Mucilaginibacter jinjuensis]|uniref:Uncharacterized protein n=1 Tax=Mucilaginibacter jinjuensis TaxID=1176721 RepID=A0ABY7T8X3_9SPHI|nr:ABC-three component system middle component 6 [Mucilaginibacter jinjuensis]WCT12336.1 hypothetical protein PQO05_00115 [Mucilaginibacter jinjuensis]